MNIGIDADGVLTDMQAFNYFFGKSYFKKAPIKLDGYTVREIFQVSKVEELIFGIKYFPKYCMEWAPREKTTETIKKLRDDGHSLHEITARKFVMLKGPIGKKSRQMFESWLNRHDIIFDSITYCSEKKGPEDKWRACVDKNIEVMVDDRPEIVEHLANKGIKVLMMDAPYNQNVRHVNITRIYSWDDIYPLLNC